MVDLLVQCIYKHVSHTSLIHISHVALEMCILRVDMLGPQEQPQPLSILVADSEHL